MSDENQPNIGGLCDALSETQALKLNMSFRLLTGISKNPLGGILINNTRIGGENYRALTL